jgi:hypothetical protein
VADGDGSILEHSRQLAFDDLRRAQLRTFVDDQGFLAGRQRRPVDGLEATLCSEITSFDRVDGTRHDT